MVIRRENHTSADDPVDPWARGGAMSDPERVVYQPPSPQTVTSSDPRRLSKHFNGSNQARNVAGVAVTLTLVAAGVVWSVTNRSSVADIEPAVAATSPVSTEVLAEVAELPEVIEVNNSSPDGTETSIGLIRWTSVQGDRSTLPAGVVASAGSAVAGRDDDGGLVWESLDGTTWKRGTSAEAAEVGSPEWSAVSGAESRNGLALSWEVPPTGGGLVDVDGQNFALLNRREEVPWRTVLGLNSSESYRIRITGDDRSLSAESSPDAIEQTVELTVQLDNGRVVFDNDGVQVWSVEAPPSSIDPIGAIQPHVVLEWLRWDGQQFVSTESPWNPMDRVEVGAVDGGLIAVATVSQQSGERAWFTPDGLRWTPVEVPGEPVARSPLPMAAHNGEVVLTVSNGSTTSYWSTSDAETFSPLADVPGINERSQGSFGWVAPDPRSSPRLRVSPDGETWETIDLSAELGFESSRWGTTITATTIESSIYVIATTDNERTMLVGTVTPLDGEP